MALIIDNEQGFEKHITRLCQTASYKFHVLRGIRKYLSIQKTRVLGNAFGDSGFNYALLNWMFWKKKIFII